MTVSGLSLRLEREVSQWDDRENNIVLLAKEMCWMMMDLADFARYRVALTHTHILTHSHTHTLTHYLTEVSDHSRSLLMSPIQLL